MRRPGVRLAWWPDRGWGRGPLGGRGLLLGVPLGVPPGDPLGVLPLRVPLPRAAVRRPAVAAGPKLLVGKRPWPLRAALVRRAAGTFRRGSQGPLLGPLAAGEAGYPGGTRRRGDHRP